LPVQGEAGHGESLVLVALWPTRILAAIEHSLSNGLIESTNTKIRLITRIAFGFKSPEALIALAMLGLGGHRPALPGRK
jgi:transposase